jgi:putative zinc finger/helix-turn-helix YgiT family protein
MKKVNIDYPYKESGLDNIIINGMLAYRCPHCSELYPIIPNIKKLHELIAKALINKPSLLLGKELVFLRKELGIKAKEIAEIFGVTKVSVSRWENTKGPINAFADRLIRLFYRNNVLRSKCKAAIPKFVELRSTIGEAPILEDVLSVCEWIGQTDTNLRNIKKYSKNSAISIPVPKSPGPLFL